MNKTEVSCRVLNMWAVTCPSVMMTIKVSLIAYNTSLSGALQLTLESNIMNGKVKVKLSVFLTKHHAMKTYCEWRYSSTHSRSRH